MNKIRKAVLPVAGLGTRFLPATIAVPKELLPIVDKPVLQFIVEEAVAAGIEEIIFVIGPGKEAIRQHFSPQPELLKTLKEKGQLKEFAEVKKISQLAKFTYVEQTEPLGDGHAVLQAKEAVGAEPFLVLFGDDLVFNQIPVAQQLMAVHERTQGTVVALQEVEQSVVSNYGVVAPKDCRERLVEIGGFIEKPEPKDAPSNLAIVGKYICLPEIFDILAQSPSSSGELRLIDALTELVRTKPIYGLLFEGQRYDTGSKSGYLAAVRAYAESHSEIAARVDKV